MNKPTSSNFQKNSKPHAFSSMVKPIGSLCNMDCHYCYYLGKSDLYDNKQPKMDDELLELYIKQYIEANDVPLVTFAWHGGEPLMAGLDYYKKAVEFQNKYKGSKKIENTLQTNGLLVTEEWCKFWYENDFLIGISIDGPADIHDNFRMDKGGRPTFSRVMAAIELFTIHGVKFNTLSTVNAMSAGRGEEVYNFLKSLGSHFMQFLPVVEYVMPREDGKRAPIVPPHTPGSVRADWSIGSKDYGHFMTDIFDVWVRRDVGEYYIQLFDITLANWVGAPPGLCAFTESCGNALVVEHNGDVFSCDHFVYPEYKLGNIKETSLREMSLSDKQKAFGLSKQNTLPKSCLSCKYYHICHGECPKHRFDTNKRGETNINALCKGLHYFYSYVAPYMDFMAYALNQEKAPALVMLWAVQQDAQNKKLRKKC